MKATTFFHGIRIASNVTSSWSNMDYTMPILQIGMSKNPVTALSITSLKYLTTIARVLCWLVSLDSSHPNEKRPSFALFHTFFFQSWSDGNFDNHRCLGSATG